MIPYNDYRPVIYKPSNGATGIKDAFGYEISERHLLMSPYGNQYRVSWDIDLAWIITSVDDGCAEKLTQNIGSNLQIVALIFNTGDSGEYIE